MKIRDGIEVSDEALADYCRRWKITELELFGSVLRDDFRPDSDIDVLVTFEPKHGWTLLSLSRMERELADLLGRSVDLVERQAVDESRNNIRRAAILSSRRPLYAAG